MKRYASLFFTILILLTGSCAKNDAETAEAMIEETQEEMEDNQITPITNLQYLALGDSYTIGEGVDEEDRWPNQLARKLGEVQIEIQKVEIIATTGWTTRDLLNGIEAGSPGKQDLVSLLIGVNNQYQKKPFEQFEREFSILLSQAIELAGNKDFVFVVSIPDYGVTPFGSGNAEGIGREIDKYNTHIAEVCEDRGIPFIDITGISREMGSGEGALTADRLHPSGIQYTRWTEAILPVVIDLFRK